MHSIARRVNLMHKTGSVISAQNHK